MDISVIKHRIAEDKLNARTSYRRYPVRFLFMELSNNTQNEILDLVKSGNGELLDLSDFLSVKNDGWLTKDRFINVIKEQTAKDKDTYVLGFSEMIRFYTQKDIESTVLTLFDIENRNIMDTACASRRICFICFSMMDNLERVLKNSFQRLDLLDPFINSDFEFYERSRQLCLVSNDYIDNIKSNKISVTAEWIGLWKMSDVFDFSITIWSCSDSLYRWHQNAAPDNAFHINTISNTTEYLQEVLGYEIKIGYLKDEESSWQRLLKLYEKEPAAKSFKNLIEKNFNLNAERTTALAGKFISTDDTFEKWLIIKYVLGYLEDTFLAKVFQNQKMYSSKELLVGVWIQGYKTSNPTYLSERLEIIKELNKYAGATIPEDEIRSVIQEGISNELQMEINVEEDGSLISLFENCENAEKSVDQRKDRLMAYYLRVFKPAYTGISDTEKQYLINLYINTICNKDDLKELYPALYVYLFGAVSKLVKNDGDYLRYLDNYRQSKINNADTSYLRAYYEGGQANPDDFYEMYYSLDRQNTLVKKYMDDNTDVYVIDGVGAEYISLLIDLLQKNGYECEACELAAAHIPTITEVNKRHFDSINYKEWIVDFDRDVIHGEYYKPIKSICKSIEYLSKIIKRITNESLGRRIIITSDHGATARAKWTDTKKKYDFSSADHEGRCCKLLQGTSYENTDDYIIYEDEFNVENKYAISLNETSLFNRPKYEDHGGATIEEVLVPVIVAIPGDGATKEKHRVLSEKLLVSGLDKKVQFTIIPDNVDNAVLIDGDNVEHILVKNGKVFQTELTSGREQNVVVRISSEEFKFVTVNSTRKNMEGDDGFDD